MKRPLEIINHLAANIPADPLAYQRAQLLLGAAVPVGQLVVQQMAFREDHHANLRRNMGEWLQLAANAERPLEQRLQHTQLVFRVAEAAVALPRKVPDCLGQVLLTFSGEGYSRTTTFPFETARKQAERLDECRPIWQPMATMVDAELSYAHSDDMRLRTSLRTYSPEQAHALGLSLAVERVRVVAGNSDVSAPIGRRLGPR